MLRFLEYILLKFPWNSDNQGNVTPTNIFWIGCLDCPLTVVHCNNLENHLKSGQMPLGIQLQQNQAQHKLIPPTGIQGRFRAEPSMFVSGLVNCFLNICSTISVWTHQRMPKYTPDNSQPLQNPQALALLRCENQSAVVKCSHWAQDRNIQIY